MGISEVSHDVVRTAVIPVAGRGTRLLPATKAVRKEMLPVGRKPLIQYAVEEARESGVEQVVFVCHPADSSPIGYFQRDADLEARLRLDGRGDEADLLSTLGAGVTLTVAFQQELRGLADAIRCAREAVADEPFGVILPDALILSAKPCLAELLNCFRRHGGAAIATRQIQRDETRHYGILDLELDAAQPKCTEMRVRGLVEKPAPDDAPSLYGIFGRYVLPPTIFDVIDKINPDSTGELQITDALNLLCKITSVYGVPFSGVHYDTGNWKGFAEATLACFRDGLGLC